ncbi:MAG: cell division protein ZapB [Acidobacteria bacterium]|nr:MAG: cell division protein ZapB [Acidobacteriota bacterium]REK01607.1 MAG: cell division protein ZapB [Acidobacteriota bacterium]REK14563.1 MAG: cell division protein ZapB [Acidobacteriota bacterium]REK45278.1 MAG: cell division protein ZapB [Acidobacteriota bacterium]
MNGLAGMEKFSHLEDKIYLTIEFAKKIREENERIDSEMNDLKDQITELSAQNAELEKKIEELMSERDAIQLKIEAMLDAITVIEPEVGEVFQGS